MAGGPLFEPANGNCEAQRCQNPAKYRAKWPNTSKLVCDNHKKDVTDKLWPQVAGRVFGNAALAR